MRIPTIALAAAAAGLASAAYQTYGQRRDARRFPPPGRLVDIGGRRIHLWCKGEGKPTVVVLPSLGGSVLEWAGVQRALQDHMEVCLVDRAGIGWSDPGPWPRTYSRMANELHAALEAAHIPPPYVIVGHSIGGLIARLYCARHREHVAALVLVESSHEDQSRHLRRFDRSAGDLELYWRAFRWRVKPPGLRRAAVDLGINKGLRQDAARTCPPDLVDTYIAMSLTSRKCRAAVQEMIGFATSDPALRKEARELGQLPVTMITAGVGREGREAWYPGWLQLQDDLATLSNCTTRLFAEHAGHHVHLDDQDFVVEAIRNVVSQVRVAD